MKAIPTTLIEEFRTLPSDRRYVVANTGVIHGVNGRPLKPWLNNPELPWAHLVIRLGKSRKRYIHDLVLETFAGPKPEGSCVRHLDGNSRNNHIENLRYGTDSENAADRVAHGTHHNARRTHCKRRHEFTPENTYIIPTTGSRQCRTCRQLRAPAVNEKRRAVRRGLVTAQSTNQPTHKEK